VIGPLPDFRAVSAGFVRASEFLPGLWRFRLPVARPEVKQVNAYAIEQEDGLMLIDCGLGGDETCWQALVAALALAGFVPADVRALVATHAHPDHMGLAEPLIAASGCTFHLHPDHAHLYNAFRNPAVVGAARRGRARREGVPEDELDLYGDMSEETDAISGAPDPDELLVDGICLTSGLGELRVLETPGHAPSHVALYAPAHRILFSADLVYTWFGPYFDYGLTPNPVAEFLASLDRIEALDVVTALPGHGSPIEDLASAVAAHRAGIEQRLAAV